jgi:streptogramin lyase
VSNYTDPTIDLPQYITTGPDGALWFTNLGNNSIGRITVAGQIANYTAPGVDEPDGITAGPDGALWFTNSGNNSIGRITTTGVITSFSAPNVEDPGDIVVGPDGALWFTNLGSIGRITTAGAITIYTDSGISPWAIAAGPDGALWFIDRSRQIGLGRVSTTGAFGLYVGNSVDLPNDITTGPDGNLWYTLANSAIGKAVPPAYVTLSPTSGGAGQAVVASGVGFAPSENVDVDYMVKTDSSSGMKALLCLTTTTSTGTFSCDATVPTGRKTGAAGIHDILAEGQSSRLKAEAAFDLTG